MTEIKREPEAWCELVSVVNSYRKTTDGKKYRKELAELRRGVSKQTEYYAFPYVLPYAQNDSEGTALLRAIGLMATFHDIPQCDKDNRLSLGQSFYMASTALHRQHSSEPFLLDPKSPDSIASRLRQLDNLDLEQAVQVLHTLFSLMRQTNVPIDFYALTRLLLRWGKGISPESRAIRETPLRDYYRGAKLKKETSEENN